jgi:hypothetical protein
LEEAKTTSATKTTPRSDFDYEDDDDEVIWRGTSTTTAAATSTTPSSTATTAVSAKTSTQTTTTTPRWKMTTSSSSSSVKEEDEEKDPTLGDSEFDDEYLSDDSEYYSSGEEIQEGILNSVLRIRDVYPGSWISYLGSRISDPGSNNSNKREGGKFFVLVLPFL